MAYGEAGYEERSRPRRRTGRRVLIAFLVLLVVFAGLLIVADRVGASVAEDRIAQRVSQEMAARDVSSAPPEVSIGGFPFVTQVLNGKFQSISILLKDVAGKGVRVPVLDVEALNVSAPLKAVTSGQGDIVAESVQGAATVGYATVVQLIKQPNLKLAERNGRLLASLPVDILGQKFTLTGEAEVTAAKGKVQLRFAELEAEGLPTVPGVRNLITGYAKKLSIDFALPPLPFELEVKDVTALADGLKVTATARNVPLNKAP